MKREIPEGPKLLIKAFNYIRENYIGFDAKAVKESEKKQRIMKGVFSKNVKKNKQALLEFNIA